MHSLTYYPSPNMTFSFTSPAVDVGMASFPGTSLQYPSFRVVWVENNRWLRSQTSEVVGPYLILQCTVSEGQRCATSEVQEDTASPVDHIFPFVDRIRIPLHSNETRSCTHCYWQWRAPGQGSRPLAEEPVTTSYLMVVRVQTSLTTLWHPWQLSFDGHNRCHMSVVMLSSGTPDLMGL